MRAGRMDPAKQESLHRGPVWDGPLSGTWDTEELLDQGVPRVEHQQRRLLFVDLPERLLDRRGEPEELRGRVTVG